MADLFTWNDIESALDKCTVADLEPYDKFLNELATNLGATRGWFSEPGDPQSQVTVDSSDVSNRTGLLYRVQTTPD